MARNESAKPQEEKAASGKVHPLRNLGLRAMIMLLPVFAVGAWAPGSTANWHPHFRMQDDQDDPEQRGPAAPWPGGTQGGSSPNDSTSAQSSPDGAGTGAAQTSSTTNLDSAFLKKMAQSSIADIQLGQLGQQHAQNDQLHDLSKKLVREHQKLYRQLQQTANDRGLTLPRSADLKDQLDLQSLQQKQGKSFDKELARTLLADHAALLQETQDTLGKLQDGKVKDIAKDSLNKQEEDMADIRDAAKAVGISSGTIQAITERQKKSVAPALAVSGGEGTNSQPKAASGTGETSQGGGGEQDQGGSSSQQHQSSSKQTQSSRGKSQGEEQATAQRSGSARSQNSGRGPSPLELQQQRAPQSATQSEEGHP